MALGHVLQSEFVLQSDEDLGAVQVTTFIGLVMFGILLSQAYVYFSRNKDGRLLRCLVTFLLFLGACHSFTTSQTVYFDTVTKYLTRQSNSYPLTATGVIENLITALAQLFFTYNVYRLSGSISLGVCCTVLAMFRLVGGMTLAAYSFVDISNAPDDINFIVKMSWLITSSLTSGAVADVVIAAFMLYYLRKMESPYGATSATNIINRLVRISLQTGLITGMISVAVLISFQAMKNNMVWFGFNILLAKVYSNSLLVWLNARKGMRHEVQVQGSVPGSLPTIKFAIPGSFTISFVTTQTSLTGPNGHSGDKPTASPIKADEEKWPEEDEPCQ